MLSPYLSLSVYMYIYVCMQISIFARGSLHYLWTWCFCDHIAVISLISYQTIPLKVNNAVYILMRESKLLIAKNLNGATRLSTMSAVTQGIPASHCTLFTEICLIVKCFTSCLSANISWTSYKTVMQFRSRGSAHYSCWERQGLCNRRRTCWCQIFRVYSQASHRTEGMSKGVGHCDTKPWQQRVHEDEQRCSPLIVLFL